MTAEAKTTGVQIPVSIKDMPGGSWDKFKAAADADYAHAADGAVWIPVHLANGSFELLTLPNGETVDWRGMPDDFPKFSDEAFTALLVACPAVRLTAIGISLAIRESLPASLAPHKNFAKLQSVFDTATREIISLTRAAPAGPELKPPPTDAQREQGRMEREAKIRERQAAEREANPQVLNVGQRTSNIVGANVQNAGSNGVLNPQDRIAM